MSRGVVKRMGEWCGHFLEGGVQMAAKRATKLSFQIKT
jgi:hypothetical protein